MSIWKILVLSCVALIYFTPTFVANKRARKSSAAIFAVNLFFGWCFLGWATALAWAILGERVTTNKA